MSKKIISMGIVALIVVLYVTGLALAKEEYKNVATVAITGGDYKDPAKAMEDYDEWCGKVSSTYPCLLKIMPGVYDIGSNSVVMQEHIDIEGSGENVTQIIGNSDTTGVVQGASNAEVRFLSVVNEGGGTDATAISYDYYSPKILHVTAIASGGSGINCGIYINHHGGSAITIQNVSASASGGNSSYGIWYIDCTPMLTNVTAKASGSSSQSYGVFDQNDTGGASTIEYSFISGDTGSIKSQGFGSANIACTRLKGNVVNADTEPQPDCAGVYDNFFTFYPDCCPGLTCPQIP